jgi:hypothetical protein
MQGTDYNLQYNQKKKKKTKQTKNKNKSKLRPVGQLPRQWK